MTTRCPSLRSGLLRSFALGALLLPALAGGAGTAATPHAQGLANAASARTAGPARKERRGHNAQVGLASVYARMLDGRATASGEKHDGDDLTAAHRTLPLGTHVRVTNLANHRFVVVRINDRGPHVKGRIIDLSPQAGEEIGLRSHGRGVARVRLEVVPQHDPPPALVAGDARAMALPESNTHAEDRQ